MECVKQHGHCILPTQYQKKQQLAHWAKYLRRESHKLFTTGTSTAALKKAMELAELGFYKKKKGF
jgi:methylglyoxal synthase